MCGYDDNSGEKFTARLVGGLVPAVVVLLFLLAPKFFYRIEKGAGKDEGIAGQHFVFLPSRSELSPESADYERDFYDAIDVWDPEMFLFPDSANGFSSRAGNPEKLSVTQLEDYGNPRLSVGADHAVIYGEGLELTAWQPTAEQQVILFHREWLPFIARESGKCPEGIYWMDGNGRRWVDSPAVARDEIGDARSKPGVPTRLELTVGGRIPRIVLRESCGNIRLDQLALRKLRERLLQDADFAGENSDNLRTLELMVYWNF